MKLVDFEFAALCSFAHVVSMVIENYVLKWTSLLSAALTLLTLSAAARAADVPAGIPEETTYLTLDDDLSRLAFVSDGSAFAYTAGRVWIVDGDSQRMRGLISTGFTPAFGLAPDGGAFVVGETYWSRGSRGVRTDVVTIYDPKTVRPIGEVILPNGRMLASIKKFALRVTGDSRFALSANMTPATSVSVVDIAAQRFVEEVATPGCFLAIPHGESSFSSICSNGALLTVDLNEGRAANVERSDPFFDPVNDPVFDSPAYSQRTGRAFFVTYEGVVLPVDFSGGRPQFADSWRLADEKLAKKGWLPGGKTVSAYHSGADRLFVLMHRGGKWSHGDAAEEIWVFDASEGRLIGRERVSAPALTISVTGSDNPLVYTVDGQSILTTYQFASDELDHIGDADGIGTFNIGISVVGE